MRRADTDIKEVRARARQKIGKKLLNNIGLKLISVILAVVIWFFVVIMSNPKDSVTFTGIPVNLTHTELLEDKFYEVLNNTDRVRVTVEAPRNVINQLRASDIVAEADVSRLTEVNTIAVSCSVMNDSIGIISITSSPDVVQLSVEEIAQKWVNVRRSTSGEVAEGYIVANSTSDQTRIEISGPQSVVDQISYVGLDMDVTGATDTVSGNVDIRFYDVEDNLVDGTDIIKNADTMHMEVRVLATKEVPVEATLTGEPAEGYLATGAVECDPSTVVLAGTPAALADISKVTLIMDITGESSDTEKVINLKNYLNNVSLADANFNGRVNVTAHIEAEMERALVLSSSNISIENLPEGFELQYAEGQNNYRLRISGLNTEVSAVEQNAVRGTLDVGKWMRNRNMTELRPGTYDIPIDFEIQGKVKQENEVSAKVVISELEEEEE